MVNDIIKQVDENGDGQISFEEFSQMMKKLSAWEMNTIAFMIDNNFYIA